VATDKSDNWSSETVMTTLGVTYTTTSRDTTRWQHAWGLELTAELRIQLEASFAWGMFSASGPSGFLNARVGYNGSYGTESIVTKELTFAESKAFPCPPLSSCIFKLITTKLDKVEVPFVATVQRSTEVGGIYQRLFKGSHYFENLENFVVQFREI
jgi:hypothetical protein